MPDNQDQTPNAVQTLKANILAKLRYSAGRGPSAACPHNWFETVALAVRDHVIDHREEATPQGEAPARKRVYYLSLEFLIDCLLLDNLGNLGLLEETRRTLAELGIDLQRIVALEPDAALGNGGLGRLAACFTESVTSLDILAHGHDTRYEHGLFRQVLTDGWQQKQIETRLDFGNPWEFERPEVGYYIGFGGSVQVDSEHSGRATWRSDERVRVIAYDTPIVGWRRASINILRLWRARVEEDLQLDRFSAGDHIGAVVDVVKAESISRVLYPADSIEAGQELHLRQKYSFISASLQDLPDRHLRHHHDPRSLPEQMAVQLNDTHPAIAVVGLMRQLVDVHQLARPDARALSMTTLSYTNHTLLPEALESWLVALMERLLPRHMQIIYLINASRIDALRAQDIHDFDLLCSVSLIEEGHGQRARMGNLAFLGSHQINGVSALHTEPMRGTAFHDLHYPYPQRISNKTSGVSFRRWLFQADPGLTELLVETLGTDLLDTPERRLPDLEGHVKDARLWARFAEQRRQNKIALARLVLDSLGMAIEPEALFDVYIKCIHEYKRQLLNLLYTVVLYQEIRDDPTADHVSRVKIFAGKAAASYHQAKLIIKLTNDITRTISDDPTVRGLLKLVFLPNYNVSLAEAVIPAADLSRQISTAGLEASGASNMKFTLSGALTIGTLDGANVEMSRRVGLEHMFIFGLNAQQVGQRWQAGELEMDGMIAASPWLEEALEAIRGGLFSADDHSRYEGLVDGLVYDGRFMLCADFEAYWHTQCQVEEVWREPDRWWRSASLSIARIGWLSADRAISEYARDIWKL